MIGNFDENLHKDRKEIENLGIIPNNSYLLSPEFLEPKYGQIIPSDPSEYFHTSRSYSKVPQYVATVNNGNLQQERAG